MVPLEYELYAIIYHQRATEALYLLKNDWFTGVYCDLVPEIEVRQQYTKHDSFIFLTRLVPKPLYSPCRTNTGVLHNIMYKINSTIGTLYLNYYR